MRIRFVSTCLCLAAAAAAQRLVPEPRQVRTDRSYQGIYSESVSRELFTACDTDSDDRLDVFEASASFDALRDPRDIGGFARLDRDRDGYVTWPEFDALFREGLANGGRFRVSTSRPFVQPVPPPEPPTPLRQFLRTHDGDGDGALSPDEIQRLLQRTGLPEALAVPLRALDRDGSGKVDEAELAPWFEMLPKEAQLGDGNLSPLPQPWFDADRDRDGRIDLGELQSVLRRIDPTLAVWAEQLLARLDRNHDGKLGGEELSPPAPDKSSGTPPKPRPVPAPER